MDISIYTALSSQMANNRKMEMIANNMANVNTSGYLRKGIIFDQYMVKDGNHQKIAYVNDISTYNDMRKGALRRTGNPLDIAVEGEGFLIVETELGERYTRSGNFQINGEGVLVNSAGHPVVTQGGGNVQFNEGDYDVLVTEEGIIRVNGEDRGVLAVVRFEDPYELKASTGSLLMLPEDSQQQPEPAEGIRVIQGTVEGSNVQPVLEMTEMLKTLRAVGSESKFVKENYDLQKRLIETYGKAGG